MVAPALKMSILAKPGRLWGFYLRTNRDGMDLKGVHKKWFYGG